MAAIVHVVVDRVQTRLAWAGVERVGAADSGGDLKGRVVDKVAFTRAREPFKCMKEPEPVPDLMRGCLALVIVWIKVSATAARHRTRADVASIVDGPRSAIDAIVEGILHREAADACCRSVPHETGLEVNIQLVVTPLAKGQILLSQPGCGGPLVIDSMGNILDDELDLVWQKGLVQHSHLPFALK